MKYRLVVCLVMLLTASSIFAQQEIKGFLGVEFGQKSFVSIDILKKKNSNVEWKHPCIEIKNITFLGVTFNNLTVKFNQEDLTEGVFALYDSKSVAIGPFGANESEQSMITNNRNYITQKFANIFNNLSDTFLSKYGNPSSATPNNIIWRDKNNNTIILSSRITHESGMIGVHCYGALTITYRSGANDEF